MPEQEVTIARDVAADRLKDNDTRFREILGRITSGPLAELAEIVFALYDREMTRNGGIK